MTERPKTFEHDVFPITISTNGPGDQRRRVICLNPQRSDPRQGVLCDPATQAIELELTYEPNGQSVYGHANRNSNKWFHLRGVPLSEGLPLKDNEHYRGRFNVAEPQSRGKQPGDVGKPEPSIALGEDEIAMSAVLGLPRTAADIEAALRKHFNPQEWAVMAQVGAATGALAHRRLDLIIMNMWPCRGLQINGFEIKMSRGDFQRELKQPEKAEEVGWYCDLFWIATPRGLLLPTELPSAWGLMEVADGRCRAEKQALETPTASMDRSFCAALIQALWRRENGE